MATFPFETSVLRVDQPLGSFFVAVLPADLLLQVASSDVMTATFNPVGGGYTLSGTQRALQDKRIAQIADYIDRVDAAFPNAIILAANHNSAVGLDQDEVDDLEADEQTEAGSATQDTQAKGAGRPPNLSTAAAQSSDWTIEPDGAGLKLTIPTKEKLAAIIDGQHRLFSFTKADPERLEMQLLCAIYLDLPKPLQAQLFATINSTQKPVDRSLTYELFGYNVDEEKVDFWTPDKLAVFLTRKLGTEASSPLRSRIVVAPKKDARLEELAQKATWRVSTAVVVDGILRLISTNPKRDNNAMLTPSSRRRAVLADGPRDKAPLRAYYIDGKDALIHKLVENYLIACRETWWGDAKDGSFIFKTVGLQAQFDILRLLIPNALDAGDVSSAYFEHRLEPAKKIDFAADRFRNASGSGRSIIRRAIGGELGLL
ncbi:hypothetical protein GCM10007859_04460 [Brevundimonas denitrificans]|uniref:DGQHR domain-containing protein n=1 Tax=Brevundimonas denitrificans TaxID=1443434 RepID=A0ABQ6BHB3_9CAUL|nr:DNA phosphorothioation-associated DGQHR protein 1 [Brevundimonas denitrificans]GLS00440.1 hypothetical protein GCM10007859_04460 [Brevundimonas denitrificans]